MDRIEELKINYADVLEEIERIAATAVDEPDTITTTELSESLGISKGASRDRLKHAAIKGVIYPKMVWRVDAWGVRHRIKGYGIIKPD